MKPETIDLSKLFQTEASQSPGTKEYLELKAVFGAQMSEIYGANGLCQADFTEIGSIKLPFYQMGAISSVDLFGLDELLIFSFYVKQRFRYRKVCDIGANIGLHSIVMSKLGFSVDSFEPDPRHQDRFTTNLKINECHDVSLYNKAVSDVDGEHEFVRVEGNTTGSHLAGSKPEPYGDLTTFTVPTVAFKAIISDYDFIKIDAEGAEATLLCGTTNHDWLNTDAMVEVGSKLNATRIFEHFYEQRIPIYSQKTNWARVRNIVDMPFSYKDGSIFISKNLRGPWDYSHETE
ncbi:FkbM family methyltransferase [Litorivicinus sp.]|nr:FkbM family methyltransferase [Litorivicinus sp.]